ncbi:hypothetical protein CG471_27820 [Sphingobium sp. IP1]|nr:hypothetical protein CG471_27820 [Sphingobium sp. IP1]
MGRDIKAARRPDQPAECQRSVSVGGVWMDLSPSYSIMPAKAGIPLFFCPLALKEREIPAYAGMTELGGNKTFLPGTGRGTRAQAGGEGWGGQGRIAQAG